MKGRMGELYGMEEHAKGKSEMLGLHCNRGPNDSLLLNTAGCFPYPLAWGFTRAPENCQGGCS